MKLATGFIGELFLFLGPLPMFVHPLTIHQPVCFPRSDGRNFIAGQPVVHQ